MLRAVLPFCLLRAVLRFYGFTPLLRLKAPRGRVRRYRKALWHKLSAVCGVLHLFRGYIFYARCYLFSRFPSTLIAFYAVFRPVEKGE